MPATALQHFKEDISRAKAILGHADPLPEGTPEEELLRSDLLRSSWMFAVGALDAYFCDAYTDIVAASTISKNRHAPMALPDFFDGIRFGVRTVLEAYTDNPNWKWRMAARRMMDRENVLSLETVKKLFNKFFREKHRFFRDLIEAWILRADAKKRLFGITGTAYNALATPQDRHNAREIAIKQLEERFASLIQRRHDCIHNCDRPKVAPQELKLGATVLKVIQDVEFLVNRCDEHINSEFRQFLLGCGCPLAVINQCGY